MICHLERSRVTITGKSIVFEVSMSVIISVLLFLGVTTIYQFLSNRTSKKRYPQPGELIEVRGHKMHMYGKGNGEPTIVLTSGWGESCALSTLHGVFEGLSKETRTLIYDRPGYGWSEPAGTARRVERIAGELHELLDKSGEKAPFVFVAHSMGSLEVLEFARQYPGEVAGVVLLDGGSPEFYSEYSAPPILKLMVAFTEFVRVTGLKRLIGVLKGLLKKGAHTEDEFQLSGSLKYMSYARGFGRDKRCEMRLLKRNGRGMSRVESIGDIPLLVLTAGKSVNSGPNELAKKWDETQQRLLDWSSMSRRVVIEGVGHNFPLEKPGVVIDEVTSFIEGLKP